MLISVVFVALAHILTICDTFSIPTHKKCKPSYHFWMVQPYSYCMPLDGYKAGIDIDGTDKYVARVVVTDEKLWSAPTVHHKRRKGSIKFSWDGQNIVSTQEIDMLGVNDHSPGFGWRKINQLELNAIRQDCCLVDGGIGYKDGKRLESYIGRVVLNGKYLIGGVYGPEWSKILGLKHPFQYVDEEGKPHEVDGDFDILAYDCCTQRFCSGNLRAPCCNNLKS